MHTIAFAIIDANRLAALGLQQLLSELLPMAEISILASYEELLVNNPERYLHYFVSSAIYFENAAYFQRQPRRSIVLVHGDAYPRMAGLFTLNVCQDEAAIIRQLLALQQQGHHMSTAHPHPCVEKEPSQSILSPREIEVAVLLAKGFINKEVAERLNISLATVITHRKNIMEKLGGRSLTDIIVYVVTHGLVPLEGLS